MKQYHPVSEKNPSQKRHLQKRPTGPQQTDPTDTLTQLYVSTRRPVTSCQAFPYAPLPWKQTGWFGSVGKPESPGYGVMELIDKYTYSLYICNLCIYVQDCASIYIYNIINIYVYIKYQYVELHGLTLGCIRNLLLGTLASDLHRAGWDPPESSVP